MSLLARAEQLLLTGKPLDSLPALEAVADGDPVGGDARTAQWLMAVALGACGRYSASWEILTPLASGHDVVAGLAGATAASLHRQLGRHEVARELDEMALEVVLAHPSAPRRGEAHVDVLVGLAADAVGVGDRAVAFDRLGEAHDVLAATAPGWRSEVRVCWVVAEVSLLSNDPAAALEAAEVAVDAAANAKAHRHLAKSQIFAGVAYAELGDFGRAVRTLELAARTADRLGTVPLAWPSRLVLARVLTGLGKAAASDQCLRLAGEAIASIAADLPSSLREEWLSRPDVGTALKAGHPPANVAPLDADRNGEPAHQR